MKAIRLLLLPFLTLFALLALAQEAPERKPTPEQRFFDWTRMPFSREVYADRIERLVHRLRESGGGIFLAPSRPGRSGGETFRQNDDFLYFTGLELPDSILAVDAENRRTVLFVPGRDARFENPARANDFPGRPLGDDPELRRRSGIADVRPRERFAADLAEWVRRKRLLRIDAGPATGGEIPPLATGFHQAWSSEQAFLFHLQQSHPATRVQTAFPEIARLRIVKAPEEIARIRQAVEITAHGIRKAALAVRDGVDERTLEAELEAECKRRGSQRLAFASIIKSGPNSLWPWRILASHYDRRNRSLRPGELVIFDVGCELDYYASDIGRTFPVSGRFSAEQKRTLEMATAVADAVLAAVRPGATFAELTRVAIEATPEGERKYMQTGSFFGHHIGLAVGDPSLLEAPLEAGMVFTVEPWYYNHDRQIAVFVEDDVLVTAEGHENLSRSLPRSPEGLERLTKGR